MKVIMKESKHFGGFTVDATLYLDEDGKFYLCKHIFRNHHLHSIASVTDRYVSFTLYRNNYRKEVERFRLK